VAEFIGQRPNARVVIMTRPSAEAAAGALDTGRFAALEYVPRAMNGEVLQSLLS
jgi:hypothetical protein